MKMFSFEFGKDDPEDLPDDMPPEVKSLIQHIMEGGERVIGASLVDMSHGPVSDQLRDTVKADHERVDQLAKYMQALDTEARNTDGNKLRHLAMD